MRLLCAVMVLVVVGGVARAQTKEAMENARGHYGRGKALYEEFRFREALDEFNEAYRLTALPGFLFNIGVCNEKLLNRQAAIDAFERYLVGVPNTPDRPEVEKRIARLRNEMGMVAPGLDKNSIVRKGWFWGVVGGAAGALIIAIAVGVTVGQRPPETRTLADITVSPP